MKKRRNKKKVWEHEKEYKTLKKAIRQLRKQYGNKKYLDRHELTTEMAFGPPTKDPHIEELRRIVRKKVKEEFRKKRRFKKEHPNLYHLKEIFKKAGGFLLVIGMVLILILLIVGIIYLINLY